jgi:hypothetical protein
MVQIESPDPGSEIDPDAIERILSATGAKHIPPNLDKKKLAEGLTTCLAIYHAARERSSNKFTKDRIRRLKSILEAARTLDKRLAPDKLFDWTGGFWDCDYLHHELGNLQGKLNWEIKDLTFELEWGPDFDEAIRLGQDPRAFADRWKARSPSEWVAGYYLPELFRRQFGSEVTFHRRNSKPESLAIRFIERSLIELGILKGSKPYSREAIAKAISDFRTNRLRR